jgi:hypothetical protein
LADQGAPMSWYRLQLPMQHSWWTLAMHACMHARSWRGRLLTENLQPLLGNSCRGTLSVCESLVSVIM